MVAMSQQVFGNFQPAMPVPLVRTRPQCRISRPQLSHFAAGNPVFERGLDQGSKSLGQHVSLAVDDCSCFIQYRNAPWVERAGKSKNTVESAGGYKRLMLSNNYLPTCSFPFLDNLSRVLFRTRINSNYDISLIYLLFKFFGVIL